MASRILPKFAIPHFDFLTLAKINSNNFRASNRRTAKIVSSLYGALYLVAFFWLKANNHWSVMSVPAMFPEYADLRAVTSAVDCRSNENYIDEYVSNCDIWGRPFNYPGIWVSIFYRLNLGTESTGILGVILVFLVALSLSYWCFIAIESRVSLQKLIIFSGFIYSPSIYLLNERGNIDSLIFALITIALYLYRKNFKNAAVFLVAFGSILKIFPIVLLLTIGLRSRSILTRSLCLLGGSISFFYLIPILPKILLNTPSTNEYSFGLKTLIGGYFPQNFGSQTKIILTFSLFMGTVSFLFFQTKDFASRQQLFRNSKISISDVDIFIIIWPMFILIYTSLTSFNYRIVFVMPIVAILLRFNSNASTIAASLFMPYVILAMHLGPSSNLLAVSLLIASVNATYFWLGFLSSRMNGHSFLQKHKLAHLLLKTLPGN